MYQRQVSLGSLHVQIQRVAHIRLRQIQHPHQRVVCTRSGHLRAPRLLLVVRAPGSEQHADRRANILVQLDQRPRPALLPNLMHSPGVEMPNLLTLVRVLAILAVAQALVREIPRRHRQRRLQRLRGTRFHENVGVFPVVPTELADVPRPPPHLLHRAIVRKTDVHDAVREQLLIGFGVVLPEI